MTEHATYYEKADHCTFPLSEKQQAPVVQTLDSAIHRINHYPADKYQGNHAINWIVIYPVGSAIQRLNNWGQIIIVASEIEKVIIWINNFLFHLSGLVFYETQVKKVNFYLEEGGRVDDEMYFKRLSGS